ncbi:MAG TPA: MBL fold metallo-hydrolase [Anseongella sp.]
MLIQQFEDKGLAHFSYVVVSDSKAAVIDPGRDIAPYLDFVRDQDARVTTVLETHSHADFISGHMELARKSGARICVSREMNVSFHHHDLQDGDLLPLGHLQFKGLATPGHSRDSICFLLQDAKKKEHALFSGDTLFIGDVGRPDLRGGFGTSGSAPKELAGAMYDTIRQKLLPLPDHVLVYPAHGAGTLCGKSLKDASSSTIGAEKKGNWAFLSGLSGDRKTFINAILSEQPFIPYYFPFSVMYNQLGMPGLEDSVKDLPRLNDTFMPEKEPFIIDARAKEHFRGNHIKGSFNIPDGLKFETWLGSIVKPGQQFYLIAENAEAGERLIRRIARIGYEFYVKGIVQGLSNGRESYQANLPADFETHPERYTIIDARNRGEYAAGALYPGALNIPLPELTERTREIPPEKPLAVHCAGGYRSAIATSILRSRLTQEVYDIGNAIEQKQ